MTTLTNDQERVLHAVRLFWACYGYSPTVRDVAVEADVDDAAAHRCLRELTDLGAFSQERSQSMQQIQSPSDFARHLDEVATEIIATDATFFLDEKVAASTAKLAKAIEGSRLDAMVISGQHEAVEVDQ